MRFILLFFIQSFFHIIVYSFSLRSSWSRTTRRWIGPDWWANPIQDWQLTSGRAVVIAKPLRTLCVTSVSINPPSLSRRRIDTLRLFRLSVKLSISSSSSFISPSTRAGFRIGRKSRNGHYLSSFTSEFQFLDATYSVQGKISIMNKTVRVPFDKMGRVSSEIELKLSAFAYGKKYARLVLSVPGVGEMSVQVIVPLASIQGGVSLLADGPNLQPDNPAEPQPGPFLPPFGGTISGLSKIREATVKFSKFHIEGDAVFEESHRRIGPIIWAQYTLFSDVLRLQAQVAPVDNINNLKFSLWTRLRTSDNSGMWTRQSGASVSTHALARTVLFTVPNWRSDLHHEYTVRAIWNGVKYTRWGRIRMEPKMKNTLKIGVFSCDNGYLFPQENLIRRVRIQNPDVVYFAGDQIYESFAGFGVKRITQAQNNNPKQLEIAMLDFLRKFYLFGLQWRAVLRDRPSVILPDDHDIFQGNLFGQGGKQLFIAENRKLIYENGGYLMPGKWISAVEKAHVGHLPPPVWDATLPIGIKPYFTNFVYANVGFAVVEDRKFKSGPYSLSWSAMHRGEGAEMLGKEQESFLDKWGDNWDGHVMKVGLTQTIFAKIQTHGGRKLLPNPYNFDCGAWPAQARDRAVNLFVKAKALCLHGDQHLGALVRMLQGHNDQNSHVAFMVPGIANGWPRAWWPGKKITGRFVDALGHSVDVIAVGNPEYGSQWLDELWKSTHPEESAFRKGSGYGMVTLDKTTKLARIALYRIGRDSRGRDRTGRQFFDGFPKTVYVGGRN